MHPQRRKHVAIMQSKWMYDIQNKGANGVMLLKFGTVSRLLIGLGGQPPTIKSESPVTVPARIQNHSFLIQHFAQTKISTAH